MNFDNFLLEKAYAAHTYANLCCMCKDLHAHNNVQLIKIGQE